jgi:hypothetical protein
MSTITIPASLATAVRDGLYERLQTSFEALDGVILAPDREDPRHALREHQLLAAFTEIARALNAAGPATQPPQPITLSVEYRPVILDAIRAAVSTEEHLTGELPPLTPRRQQAVATILALNELAEQIATQHATSPPQDLQLQGLVVLAILDQPTGITPAQLHQVLDDYPAQHVDQATGELAALGLLRTGDQIHPSEGLQRIDELDLISI